MVSTSWPVGVKPSRPDKWPSWKIHTMAPKVALKLSRLSTSAFTGTSRLPNMRNSNTNVDTAIRPSAIGMRSNIAAFASTRSAEVPPTTTENGMSRLRMSCTSCSPSPETGSTFGTTENHVPCVPVCGLNRLVNVSGSSIFSSPKYVPVTVSTRATPLIVASLRRVGLDVVRAGDVELARNHGQRVRLLRVEVGTELVGDLPRRRAGGQDAVVGQPELDVQERRAEHE